MDVILNLADELILDRWWTRIFPNKTRSTSNITDITWSNLSSQCHHQQVQTPPINLFYHLSPNHPLTASSSSRFHRNHPLRQSVSIFFLTLFGVVTFYFVLSSLSYYLIFDKKLKQHPKYLKNQIRLEISCALKAFGPIDLLSLPIFLAEVRGYSKLYDRVSDIEGISSYTIIKPILERFNLTQSFLLDTTTISTCTDTSTQSTSTTNCYLELVKKIMIKSLHFKLGGGWFYLFFSYFWFLIFTDFTVYLVHKLEHHPMIYKRIHKVHHRWVIPTPFASYAFHPIDGFLQSVPYHIFIFIFPFHRLLYLFSFIVIILWTILIHDSELIVGHKLENFINSPTHHTLHHLHFNCNFGQFFTWTDKFFSTYRLPSLLDQSSLKSSLNNNINHNNHS